MLRSAAHCRRLSCATMAAGSQCIETIANETQLGALGGLQCVCWGGKPFCPTPFYYGLEELWDGRILKG